MIHLKAFYSQWGSIAVIIVIIWLGRRYAESKYVADRAGCDGLSIEMEDNRIDTIAPR